MQSPSTSAPTVTNPIRNPESGTSEGLDGPPQPSAPRERRSSFLSVLGHELRNHIAPIQNVLFLMRRGGKDPALLPLIDLVERQVLAVVKSFEMLTDAERVDSGSVDLRRDDVELAAQLNAAIELLRPRVAQHGPRFHLSVPHAPIIVNGDAARLVQAIATIVDNALTYTCESGEVWVDVDSNASFATIRVRDTGEGIAAERLPHIFEFFASRGQPTHSLGVNLAVAHRLVKLHGGNVTATSAGEGRGSEFAIVLPLATPVSANALNESAADVAADRTPVATPAVGESPHEPDGVREAITSGAARERDDPQDVSSWWKYAKRVLIADDSAPLRETLSTVLRSMGHEVRTASDGEEALAVAQAWRPEFALLDIYMPKLTGFVVARELRNRFPADSMCLVMMSGRELDETALVDAGQAGFDHCIDKAFTLEGLERLLRGDLPAATES